VQAGLACFTAVALALLLVATAGDRRDRRDRAGNPQASSARAI
jgi:hypothetical protein